MDCGSGLLLLITRAMRRLEAGELLAIRSAEASVEVDLPVWAELVGHAIDGRQRRDRGRPVVVLGTQGRRSAGHAQPDAGTVFSIGDRTPVGHRLWAYTNFDCNLACLYCCAESSPKADARRLDPAVVGPLFAEFREQGGKELLLTGGEPFMHPSSASSSMPPPASSARS